MERIWWETSNLAKCIEALSDGALVDDTEELIGACCRIMTKQYTHPTTGKVYANILDIYGMKPGTPKLKIPLDFVRKKDQPAKPGKTSKKANGSMRNLHGLDVSNDDVPFPGDAA